MIRLNASVGIPAWQDQSARDLVLARTRGPLILELKGRPSLAIQLANQDSLWRPIDLIDHYLKLQCSPAERISLTRYLFA